MTIENNNSCKGIYKRFNPFSEHRIDEQFCNSEHKCSFAYNINDDKLCWQRVNYKSFAENIKDYFIKINMPEIGESVARDYINKIESLENTLLSEKVLEKDWKKLVEDEAWKYL